MAEEIKMGPLDLSKKRSICKRCGAASAFAVPQRCICGKEGCEVCFPGGYCLKCKEWSDRVRVCPKCHSSNSKCNSWDDYDEMMIHNDYTCQECGNGWSEIVPINEDDIVRKLGYKGKSMQVDPPDPDDENYN